MHVAITIPTAASELPPEAAAVLTHAAGHADQPPIPNRHRWQGRMRKAQSDLKGASPAAAAALAAYTDARVAESETAEDLTDEQVELTDRLFDELTTAPSRNLFDVAAKIALGAEFENGGALLRRSRALDIIADEDADRPLRASAHAYLDCLRMAEAGSALRNMPWAELRSELRSAEVAWAALPDDATEAEDTAAGDAHAEVEVRLERLPSPTVGALAWKLANHLQSHHRLPETMDDLLVRLLKSGDFGEWPEAIAVLDATTLARLAGEDVPLYPRAMNARLATLGVVVRPDGFAAPQGFRPEATALLSTVSDEQVQVLMAAAWIDAYLAADGGVAMVDVGAGERVPHFWKDVRPGRDPELDRLHAMLAVREGGDGRLRMAVVDLITEQLAERGVLSCGRAAA